MERASLVRQQIEPATTQVVVRAKREIATAVVELTLGGCGQALPDWTPGAHVDVLLPTGSARQYSLLPSARCDEWRVAVLREAEGRGGSRFIHDDLRVGDRLATCGPRNNFPLQPADEYLFLAGGIGVTPLVGMAVDAERRGVEWSMLYCGRTRTSMAMADELGARWPNRVDIHSDDERGLPDLAALLTRPRPGTVVYACGPTPFLDAVTAAMTHWPPGSLHVERFTPVEHASSPDAAFEVELRTSGRVLTVPAGRSALEVIQEAGVQVLSSCTEGTCGTCETVVLEGEVDHRDAVLSPEEQAASETMMICVSRARGSRLVLEL
jgi:ferredoxin-NADP reductase